MERRIFGIETEYGVAYAPPQQAGGTPHPALSPDEVARYLFRRVVAWGRSSNVFLANGSRLYLDVGSHPEYATAECDDLSELVAQDKAGERLLSELVGDAESRLRADGFGGEVYLFKNNTDSAGNSYGCHENYLIARNSEFAGLSVGLLPFLVSRQILVGAGKIVHTPAGAIYAFSQRADHMWEGVSSATTRSRPMINTRDEPHADAENYRRLHVIAGDANMAEPTTLLKTGSMHLVLRMIEEGWPLRDWSLENPVRAVRAISHDLTCRTRVDLAGSGTSTTAVGLQAYYLDRARAFLDHTGDHTALLDRVLDLWERAVKAVETGDYALIDHEIDWAIKLRLIDRFRARHGVGYDDARAARIDLAYHDIDVHRGLYYRLAARDQVERVVTDARIRRARDVPPQTTRAKLRGDFVRAAQEHRRDFTVDWVHLKLNDQAQRTVLCADPLATTDERVDRLISHL